MPHYSISYDLPDAEAEDYETIAEAIENYSEKSVKYCSTAWLVKCSGSAGDLRDMLQNLMTKNIKVLVVKVVNNWASYLSTSINDEIRDLFDS